MLKDCASPAEAVDAMLARLGPVGVERVPLDRAGERVLARPILADRPSPAFDVSAMDGYAVCLADLAPGRHAVAGEVRIGRAPPGCGGVVRVVTGGAIPTHADAVIKREDVREAGDTIEIDARVVVAASPGQYIRRRGENAGEGEEVVGAGVVVTPPVAAALSSFGVAEPEVFRRVRVGVLVTGDEVLNAAAEPTAWQVQDANGPVLRAFVQACPWAEVGGWARAADKPVEIRSAIESLLDACDALLITGGVSMGDRDFVPASLRDVGAEVVFHRVRQRPGRPVLGAVRDGKPVLALPGNPVSVIVTGCRMAMPVLAAIGGVRASPPWPTVLIDGPGADKTLDLWWHRVVRRTGPGRAEFVDTRSSGDVAGAARSDGFVEIPPGCSGAGPWAFFAWDR